MKRWLLFLLTPTPLAAASLESVLPPDLFIGGQPGDVMEIRRLTQNTYEFTLKKDPRKDEPGAAAILNIFSFCAASALAHMQGYATYTIGQSIDRDSPTKDVRTLVLLRNPAEIASLPTDKKWLPSADMGRMRGNCDVLLTPKYLWPAK